MAIKKTGKAKSDSKVLNPGSAIPNDANGRVYSSAFSEGYKHALSKAGSTKLSNKALREVAAQKYAKAQQLTGRNRLDTNDVGAAYSRSVGASGTRKGKIAGRLVAESVRATAASNRRSASRKRGD